MEFTNVLRSYKMNLSNQAVGAIMMALQKAILHHEDISGLLKEFNLGVMKKSGLKQKAMLVKKYI